MKSSMKNKKIVKKYTSNFKIYSSVKKAKHQIPLVNILQILLHLDGLRDWLVVHTIKESNICGSINENQKVFLQSSVSQRIYN